MMRDRTMRSWSSTALLLGGALLAACSSNPPAMTSQGTDTQSTAPSAPAAAPPPPPAAPRTQGRKGKIRLRMENLAAKEAAAGCGLANDKVYRLILTKNDDKENPPCPAPATDAEKGALGDTWAQQVLLKNAFPMSVADIVTQMGKTSMTPTSFLVGEGGQIPTTVQGADRNANRNLRYVVSWNSVVFLSARPGPHSSFLQVVAWDAKKNWFNFYEYNDDTLVWSWTGNSSYATQADTKGHGCFDCHHNGVVIMKELTAPWNNWHSTQAAIVASVVPQAVADEALFQQKGEASLLEGIVEGYQQKFHSKRIDGLIVDQNQINGVPDLLRTIISQSTVNLVSSPITSQGAGDVAIPTDLFIRRRLTALVSPNLQIPNTIPRGVYNQFLQAHDYRLVQERDGQVQYAMPGSTHFAFLVPAYSAEDDYIAKYLVDPNGLVDAKFEAAVMMVDFQNPIFSPVREGLLAYAEQLPTGTWASPQALVSDVPARFAQLVEQAAKSQPACKTAQLEGCTAQQQFLYFWKQTGDAWKTDAAKRLQAYADSVGRRIKTPDGASDYLRLAVSRQAQMKSVDPIDNLVEFSLLFPQTDLPRAPLRMHVDGTVGTN